MHFADLIAPLSSQEFLSEFWDSKPLVMQTDRQGRYEGLLRKDEVDGLLSRCQVRFPDVKAVRKGRPIPLDAYYRAGWLSPPTAGEGKTPQAAVLYDAYAKGFTITVRVERLSEPLALLCRDLERVFHCGAIAELFMTPKGAQGLAPHADGHDVFVLQLEGTKSWSVYPRTDAVGGRLQDYKIFTDEEQLGAPLHELTLAPGDLLFMPQGFPHKALASQSPSLHVSIGLYPTRWGDVLSEALQMAIDSDERFRRRLPPAFLGSDFREHQGQLGSLLLALLEKTRSEAVFDRLAKKYCHGLRPLGSGQFCQLDGVAEVGPQTKVRRRPGTVAYVTVEDGSAAVYFPGNAVKLAVEAEALLRLIQRSCQPVAVAELPGPLDIDGKVSAACRLIQAGLLQVVP